MRPRHPAYTDVPERVFLSNPFVFKQFRTFCAQYTMEIRNPFALNHFRTLFDAMAGECLSCPSAPHSSLALRQRKSCFCRTSKNRPLTPLFATHPKTGSRKSLICHTCDTPRGAVYLLLPNPGRVRWAECPACCVACLRPSVTVHHSRVTAIRPIACTIPRCHNWPCTTEVLGNKAASFGV
jgi:hypothetical protein